MKSHVESYFEQGFAVIPGLVSPALLEKVFLQIDTLLGITIENQGDDPKQYEGVNQKYLHLKDRHPTMKARAYDLMKMLDAVHGISVTPDLLEVAHEITGTPVFVNNTLIRPDDFTNDRRRPFHQEGVGQISYDSVNVWIPLVDVNEETGTMRYIPGSHKQGYVRHQFYPDYNNYHGVLEELVDENNVELACLSRGDALIFHPCLFHGSAPMTVDKGMRWTLISRLSSMRQVPYLQDEAAPLHTEQNDSEIVV